jgi:hypothetical protein
MMDKIQDFIRKELVKDTLDRQEGNYLVCRFSMSLVFLFFVNFLELILQVLMVSFNCFVKNTIRICIFNYYLTCEMQMNEDFDTTCRLAWEWP